MGEEKKLKELRDKINQSVSKIDKSRKAPTDKYSLDDYQTIRDREAKIFLERELKNGSYEELNANLKKLKTNMASGESENLDVVEFIRSVNVARNRQNLPPSTQPEPQSTRLVITNPGVQSIADRTQVASKKQASKPAWFEPAGKCLLEFNKLDDSHKQHKDTLIAMFKELLKEVSQGNKVLPSKDAVEKLVQRINGVEKNNEFLTSDVLKKNLEKLFVNTSKTDLTAKGGGLNK